MGDVVLVQVGHRGRDLHHQFCGIVLREGAAGIYDAVKQITAGVEREDDATFDVIDWFDDVVVTTVPVHLFQHRLFVLMAAPRRKALERVDIFVIAVAIDLGDDALCTAALYLYPV